jgi:peptide/nickel transport system substrate-binding protein
MEDVRKKIAVTTDPVQLKKLAEDVQRIAIDEVLLVPLGEFTTVTARRKSLANQIDTSVPVFWNMTKGGK